jgi:HD-like signal output (HDOD) protein
VLSCLNSAFYVTSRVLFTLAGHNDAPQWMVKLNARHVPARSVLVGTAAGLIGVFAAVWSPGGVFAFLVNASGALILYVYMLTAIAQIRLRRRAEAHTLGGTALGGTALGGTTLAVTPARLKMWWFPWSSYAAIGGIVAVLLAMALTPSLASEFYVSLTTLAVSLAAYALTAYSRSRTRPKHGAADSTTQVAALKALPDPPADPGNTAAGGGSAASAASAANATDAAENVRAQTLRALMELAFGVTLPPGAAVPAADAGIGADIAAILARIADQPNYAPRRPMQLPKLMRAINDENASRSELAQILAGDPALAGNLLRLANSPFYRYRSDPIESLDRAVAVLGIEGLRSMIAAALLQPVFRISGGSFTQFGEVTWEHSLFALMAAEGHATLVENADPFAAQLLALMSGLATIVIFTVAQDTYLQRQRTPEASIIAGLIAAHVTSVARQIAASWELSERIDTALAEQIAAAPASALGRSLRFGEFIGALAVLRSRGIVDDQAAHAVLRSAETETGANERIWTRLRAIAL